MLELAGRKSVRFGFAALFVCFHLAMFWRAGHLRLGLPFDDAPGESVSFSDVHAPSTRGYPRQPHHWSRLVLSRWDAQHYIGMATRGLSGCPDHTAASDLEYLDCGLGWLPAFGLTGGVVAKVTRLAPDFALVLISLVAAFFVNFLLTAPMITDRIGRIEAYGALLAFNLFPSAFYMVAPYTEALTLALALGGLWALSKQRWFVAAAMVGATTALRAQGAAFAAGLGLALLYVAYTRWRAKTPRWWVPVLAGPLCVWGQVATVIGLRFAVGDARAFLRARNAFGDQHFWSRVVQPTNYLKGIHAQHLDMVVLAAVMLILILTAREVLQKFPREQAIYLATATLVTIPASIVAPLHWWGINRYLLMCTLVFLGAGVLARRHRAFFILWLFLSLALYWHVELCSYVAQGDPKICPCLGGMEFTMPFGS